MQWEEILPVISSQSLSKLARLWALKNYEWTTFNESRIPVFKIPRNPALTQRAPSFPTPNPDIRTAQNYHTCQLRSSSERTVERSRLQQTQENRKRKDSLITKATEWHQRMADTDPGAQFTETTLKQLQYWHWRMLKVLNWAAQAGRRLWPLSLSLQLPRAAVTTSSHRLIVKTKSSLVLVKLSDTAVATAVKKPVRRLRFPFQSRVWIACHK